MSKNMGSTAETEKVLVAQILFLMERREAEKDEQQNDKRTRNERAREAFTKGDDPLEMTAAQSLRNIGHALFAAGGNDAMERIKDLVAEQNDTVADRLGYAWDHVGNWVA
jgi:L-lactate utilization protein LutB